MFPRLRLIGRRLRGTSRSVCNGFRSRGFSRRRADLPKSLICQRLVVLYNERVVPLPPKNLVRCGYRRHNIRCRGVIADVFEVLYFLRLALSTHVVL